MFYLRLKYLIGKLIYKYRSKDYNLRTQVQETYRLLSPLFFGDFRTNQLTLKKFTVIHPNIETYTVMINNYLLIMKDRPLRNSDMLIGSYNVSMEDFLVSNDGHYINYPSSISKFKLAILKLCIAIKDSDTATHGVSESNLRHLRGTLNNLLFIGNILNLISENT